MKKKREKWDREREENLYTKISISNAICVVKRACLDN